MGTELGAPFSREINDTLILLFERGFLQKINNRLIVAGSGIGNLNKLSGLTINYERMVCLRAACSSTSAMSIGMINRALTKEPELSRSKAMPLTRLLLEENARAQLYEHFKALKDAVNFDPNDLRLPAFVWLTALYKSIEITDIDA